MHTYAQLSTHILLPMAIGALLVLIVALQKGEICPGQRGRLHRQIPILASVFFISAGAMPVFIIPAALLTIFSVQAKTGKTRESGPVFLLWLTVLSSSMLWLASIVNHPSLFLFGSLSLALSELVFLGASLAHLLMVRAKTRLQAFHTLLPIAGVISLMLVVLSVLIQTYWAWPADNDWVLRTVAYSFSLLISAVIVWCWHLFRTSSVHGLQVAAACALSLAGSYLILPLFY
ncbi:hypothetical protein [Vibrio ezurae]|uniref:Cytochrome c assembly protein domain-containing protein n=1 Tax=Vibrio ezurae NBRC 102218 TaxID=1219080 RepID=U3CLR8_9VIBR|nr:hypothetical protein [Vibrio ezurae]GAD79138.1 hypothetical protein VEZ01S_08_01740 [Vibrio ezurae NBRC 102218]